MPRPALKNDRATAASVVQQLRELDHMDMAELVARYAELFGFPSRTRNKPYLRKKLAWRIQELAEGGLPESALKRIEELAPLAPVRWRTPLPGTKDALALVGPSVPRQRDPRLPPAGTVLVRAFRGVEHRATVLEDGVEYQGKHYSSLTPIACLITGTRWNGFLFWGLQSRSRAEEVQS